jgi:adenylate cyclase
MALKEDVLADIKSIAGTLWDQRAGRQVPSTSDVALAGGAVEIDATFLYADLADSSKMAKELDRRIAAKIIKSFLATSARIIRSHGGEIRSFDGDRIMGVFYGGYRNTSAAKCGLRIAWAVNQIRGHFEAKYESVRGATFKISHAVGVDSGTVLAVRGGARGSNDLIWIGRPPNLAAKMSDFREPPYQTFITAAVFNRLNDEAKARESDNVSMWERRTWTFLGETIIVYRSSFMWSP